MVVGVGGTTNLPQPREPMHLASDYIHPYKDAGGRSAHCRVRIYLPDDMRDAPVVIRANELPTPWYGSSTGLRNVPTVGRRRRSS
jgi:hypothetical protein